MSELRPPTALGRAVAENDRLRAEADRLREALRETREALVIELPEGEQSLKWKNVLGRSRAALGDTPDE